LAAPANNVNLAIPNAMLNSPIFRHHHDRRKSAHHAIPPQVSFLNRNPGAGV